MYRAGGYSPGDIGKFVPVIDQAQGVQFGGRAGSLRGEAKRQDATTYCADATTARSNRIQRTVMA